MPTPTTDSHILFWQPHERQLEPWLQTRYSSLLVVPQWGRRERQAGECHASNFIFSPEHVTKLQVWPQRSAHTGTYERRWTRATIQDIQTWWHTLRHACLTNRILYLPRIFSSPRELQPTTSLNGLQRAEKSPWDRMDGMFWVTEGRIRKLYLKMVAADGFLMCPAPLFFFFFFFFF